jgi:hypothetical protein
MNQNNKGLRLMRNRPVQGHGDRRSRVFHIVMILVLLGFIPFIQACDIVEATKERGKMAMTETNSERYTAKPPIDASAPSNTETATFALG